MTTEVCPICMHPLQAQIEAEFVAGTKSATDVVAIFEEGVIDILDVLMHFEEHPTALEKAAEEKERKRRLKEASTKQETKLQGSVPVLEPESTSLDVLEDMLNKLQLKFDEVILTKQAHGISQLAREIRENLKEITRVKKERKRTLADKTSELFAEYRALTRWLLHNMCEECQTKFDEWLAEAKYVG